MLILQLEDAFQRLGDQSSQRTASHQVQRLKKSPPPVPRSRFQRSLSKRGKLGWWSTTQRLFPSDHYSANLLFENPVFQISERDEPASLSGRTTPDPSPSSSILADSHGYTLVRRPFSIASESTYAQSTSEQSIPSDHLSRASSHLTQTSSHLSRECESVSTYYYSDSSVDDSSVDKEWEQWIQLREVK